jgi:hypothetical protein
MKTKILALLLATWLCATPVRADGGIGHNNFYMTWGVYYTSSLYPFLGRACYWTYVLFDDGSSYYSDTCGGGYGQL